eukprot:Skav203325  [mRNA]  locus=scaffold284:205564:206969:- [translate_table: standard]
MFSIMEVMFTEVAKAGDTVRMSEALQGEMLLLEALLPMAQFNLRAKLDGTVTCSDACETRGGMCFSTGLSRSGRAEAERLMMGEETSEDEGEKSDELPRSEKVLVIDLFAGISGLTVALEKAGVKARHVVAVEKDRDCRRLLRRKLPGVALYSDVRAFGRKEIQKAISKAVRIFEEVEEIAMGRDIWCVKMLENVVADEEDIIEMSDALRLRPVLVEAADLSRVKRPRLYWLSHALHEQEDVEVTRGELYDRVKEKPPPDPAGLRKADGRMVERWTADKYRYPPYVYHHWYLVEDEGQEPRVLCSHERGTLMGYPKGYTLALFKTVQKEGEAAEAQEDQRCAALGNSFHTNTVACIFDQIFEEMKIKKRKGQETIVGNFVYDQGRPRSPDP